MRVEPFFSPFRGIAVEEVWHNNDQCQIARSIASPERLPGTNDRKHCKYFQLHNQPFKVEPTRTLQ
jgi:hypothetical protein